MRYRMTVHNDNGSVMYVTTHASLAQAVMRLFRLLLSPVSVTVTNVPDMDKRISFRQRELAKGGLGLTKYREG